MSIHDLPVEIVERICDCLDRNSLFQLALVSRNCRNGAASHMFQTVSIRFTTQETFVEKCEYADSILVSPTKSRHVRHLRIFGFMKGDTSGPGDWDIGPHMRNRGLEIPRGVFTDSTNCEKLLRVTEHCTTLRDFTWGFLEQIPLSILNLLHESSPLIRLHMPLFCLKSLILSPDDPIYIDPHDLKVATSSCLYSLGYTDFQKAESQGLVDYNSSAIFEIVAGAAPNLREGNLNVNPMDPPSGSEWLSGTILKDSPGSSSHLEHLSISTSHYLARPTRLADSDRMGSLEKLKTMMDFTVLRTLKIGDPLFASHVQWLTEKCRFPCLDSLDLNLWDVYNAHEMETKLNIFLLSLPHLRSFAMRNRYFPSTVPLVLDHSGSTLRSLHMNMPGQFDDAGADSDPDLWASADADLIRTIQRKAPLIEDLALPIERSGGDSKEVAIYRELGKLTSLQRLYLSVYHSAHCLWDGNGAMHGFLASEGFLDASVELVISLAIDEALVRSIFHTISCAKPLDAAPLQTLKYRVDALEKECSWSSDNNWILLLAYIARSFDCTRNVRADNPQQCLIEEYHEYGNDGDRLRLEGNEEFHEWVDEYYLPILQKVWPGVEGRDWMNRWHSFPLST